ncbi:MAG: nickel pincer cofactor biosynthesis protein LarB [Myxococcales bacterium]|nr:nickel pincer cofactor biosynthesis protein LarB [Myxococcales bacterium]
MDTAQLRALLEQFQRGDASLEGTVEALRELPFSDLGFAMVDHHRALRQGVPEVIFGQGKVPEHLVAIAKNLAEKGQNVLATRVAPEVGAQVTAAIAGAAYNPIARVVTLVQKPIAPLGKRPVALVCAGTSDVPVAEEAAETLRMLGVGIERVYDVGVAGIHRLLARREVFDRSSVAIVVAGMEGALPSAVGGMVSIPVIAVPTSVGYGAGSGGFAALFAMLTSCASGITVCNIDNGFGAAFAAARILQSHARYA